LPEDHKLSFFKIKQTGWIVVKKAKLIFEILMRPRIILADTNWNKQKSLFLENGIIVIIFPEYNISEKKQHYLLFEAYFS